MISKPNRQRVVQRVRWGAVLGLFALGLALPTQGQGARPRAPQIPDAQGDRAVQAQDSAAATPAVPDFGPVGPLSPGQIPRQAERDDFRRTQILDSIASSGRPAVLRRAVEELQEDLAVVSRYESVEVTGGMGVRDLEAVLQQWRAISGDASRISDAISRTLEHIERWQTEGAAMSTRWERTRIQVDSSALYLATAGQIQAEVAGLQDLIERLDTAEFELLALASTAAEIENRVRVAIAGTVGSLSLVRRRLLEPNQPPLWRIPAAEYSPVLAFTEAGVFLRGRIQFVRQFFRGMLPSLLAHLVLLLMLAAFVRWLSRFIDQAGPGSLESESLDGEKPEGSEESQSDQALPLVSGEDEHRWAVRALVVMANRPLASGYLLSLFFLPFLYGRLPLLVSDVFFLVSMVPAARLASATRDSQTRSAALSLVGIASVTYAISIALTATPFKRVLLLLMAVATMGFLLRLLGWIARVESPPIILRMLAGVVRIMAWAMAVSIVGAVFGFTNLTSLLVLGAVAILYVTLLLRILYLALEGMLSVLPYTPVSKHVLSIRSRPELLAAKGRRVIQVLLSAVWLLVALRFFGLIGPAASGFRSAMAFGPKLGPVHLQIGGVLAFVVTLWVAVLLSRFLRFIFMEDVVPRADWPKGIPEAAATLGHYGILTIGFAIALMAANMPLDRVALLVSALGIGIGFGLQAVVNNFVSGLILLFERPVAVGDTIELGPLLGDVQHIGMRASYVRTFDGAEVIVPNSELVQAQVINWTHSDRTRRLDVKVGVKYGTDPEMVLPLLRSAAASHPEVLRQPEPVALFKEFGESSLNFSLRFWVADHQRFMTVWSEVTIAVNKALREARVEIPFPQRDLHFKSVEGAAAAALGRAGQAPSQDSIPSPNLGTSDV